jgi:hypothetical protein
VRNVSVCAGVEAALISIPYSEGRSRPPLAGARRGAGGLVFVAFEPSVASDQAPQQLVAWCEAKPSVEHTLHPIWIFDW